MSDCCDTATIEVPIEPRVAGRIRTVALVGPPNSGKSTLFNRLTGLRQKVANYPGVTVEQRVGRLNGIGRSDLTLIDLPGIYGLDTYSEDARVAVEVLHGEMPGTPAPDAILLVLDSLQLRRQLMLAAPVLSLGLPTLVLLNMSDLMEARGGQRGYAGAGPGAGRAGGEDFSDAGRGAGCDHAFSEPQGGSPGQRKWFSGNQRGGVARCNRTDRAAGDGESAVVQAMGDGNQHADEIQGADFERWTQAHRWRAAASDLGAADFSGGGVCGVPGGVLDWAAAERRIGNLLNARRRQNWLRCWRHNWLESLLIDGVWSGVASVLVFLPQILLLFLFIGVLEDSGYLARAALIADRVMRSIGLNGKAFIPLLSAYACAVPAIMATRTIENKRDRFATILVAPFMTCSARLPIYMLMIAAFIPNKPLLGDLFGLRAVVMLSLYVLGFLAALVTAWLLKSSILKASSAPFILELPQYRLPTVRSLGLRLYDRGKVFLKQAGTVILGVTLCFGCLSLIPFHADAGAEFDWTAGAAD